VAERPVEGEQPQAGAQQQHGSGQQQQQQPANEQPAVAARSQQQPAAAQPAAESRVQPASTPVVTAPAVAETQPVARVSETATRTVRMSQAAEAVENAIRIGSQRGVTHARMSLKPAELGGVEIRLQQTAQGLTASVVADGAQAAQLLQQAGNELRRSLEAQGIQLQQLDITYSGEQRDDSASSAQAQAGDGERRSSADGSVATDGDGLTTTEDITVKETLELPDGVLVDVLA
jgi:flagellar hook-length control protein FliK